MSLNGKRDNFTRDDIATFASAADLTRVEGLRILDNICEVVERWPVFGADAGVDATTIASVKATQRMHELAPS